MKGRSVVYVIAIGKFIKVGFTTNLNQRIKAFRTSTAETIRVLATFEGGRTEERRLHDSLAETRLQGEFFHYDWRISNFADFMKAGEPDKAWQWLETTHKNARRARVIEDRKRRDGERRQTKAEFDAYIAGLVADRRRRTGW